MKPMRHMMAALMSGYLGVSNAHPAPSSINCDIIAKLAAAMRGGDIKEVDVLSDRATEFELRSAINVIPLFPANYWPGDIEWEVRYWCRKQTGQVVPS